jgi:hypothetical protein
MHEYVKKVLATALLIVSAAIVPSLPTFAGFPDPKFQVGTCSRKSVDPGVLPASVYEDGSQGPPCDPNLS